MVSPVDISIKPGDAYEGDELSPCSGVWSTTISTSCNACDGLIPLIKALIANPARASRVDKYHRWRDWLYLIFAL